MDDVDDRVRLPGGGRTAVVTRSDVADAPPAPRTPPTPGELLRDAWAIRRLLDDLGDDEHRTRAKLLLARDQVRREAARQWRGRGWRPITDEF